MKRVIVVGNGMTGLTCAYAFLKFSDKFEVKVLGSGENGGEFLESGTKYMPEGAHLSDMFEDLCAEYSDYSVRGGLLLRGVVNPFPLCLKNVDKEEVLRIKRDYYVKSRLMEPGKFVLKSFNDSVSNRPTRAVRANFHDVVKALVKRLDIHKQKVTSVTNLFAFTEKGKRYKYDYIVFTIPIWEVKKCLGNVNIPEGVAVQKNSIVIGVCGEIYEGWDYVMTPYTPENNVYRIVCESDSECAVETSGKLQVNKLFSDLNYLFRGGWFIKKANIGLKGCLLPMNGKIAKLPENMSLLGRYSVWDNRVTLNTILSDSISLAKRWN